MKRNVFLLALFLIASSLYAQQSTINLSGTVKTPKGEPVKGVLVSVVEGSRSAKTNKNGEFLLKKVRSTDQIEVVIQKKRVAVFPLNGNQQVRIDLLDNHIRVIFANGDDEMYVLNEVPKRVARQLGIVTAEMIEKSGVSTLKEVFRQFVPHVQFITLSSGETALNFRGESSFYNNSGALILIDGAEISYSSAEASVNIHDIATIEAIKDGAGYGVRGSSGVILITTKR